MHRNNLLLLTTLLFFYTCRKDSGTNGQGTRLQQIIYPGLSNINGGPCSTCYMYILFEYDGAGRLVTITDTSIYLARKKLTYHFTYDGIGRISRMKTVMRFYSNEDHWVDTMIYNNQNQVIQTVTLERNLFGDSDSTNYTYDSKGMIIGSFLHYERSIVTGYPYARSGDIKSITNYDNNGNYIDAKNFDFATNTWSYERGIQTVYDDKKNPFSVLGIIGYLVVKNWDNNVYNRYHSISTNNVLQVTDSISSPLPLKFEYTYYPNGMVKTKSRPGTEITERYVYE